MIRDPARLTERTFDICVVGGGIHGASVAWDAALRGLSVALVEKGDFGSATSANSLKIIHGGFRYLQHADIGRMRESARERAHLMRIAPHLVHPLPVLIPAYGHWTQRREVLSAALLINDIISFDRNRRSDPEKRIPRGRVISREEALVLLPGIQQQGLRGAALFFDAQVYNSERLVLAFLRSAERVGAELANYVEATGLLRSDYSVVGVEARDSLTGEKFEVRARTIVNACGPWVSQLLQSARGHRENRPVRLAKAMNLVTRPIFQKYAVGIMSKSEFRDPDAVVNRGNRLFFIAPWRDRSLIGTTYTPYDGDPDGFDVTASEVRGFLDEVNQAFPAADLRMEDVSFVHRGLVPSSGVDPTNRIAYRAKRSRIVDHQRDGLEGLISVIGVKYTTGRLLAEKVVDRVVARIARKSPRSATSVTPLEGASVGRFNDFQASVVRERPPRLGEETARRMALNYGSAYHEVMGHAGELDDQQSGLDDTAALKAQVRYAVRQEMAVRLSDVVFRRTEIGSAGHPGGAVLEVCAETMAAELGWDPVKTRNELRDVEMRYEPLTAPARRNGPVGLRSGRQESNRDSPQSIRADRQEVSGAR